MDLKPGDKLGPYEILGLIGAGGMGKVYKARDPRLARDVAIKVAEHQFTSRFEREARAIGALNHPNICQVHDIGPNYLVMEYIEGTPPRGPVAPAEAVRLARAIAAGLEAAHAKGFTHRDLKPANILVTHSGSQPGLKLLDFGLALVNDNARNGNDDATTGGATVIGTVGYMSPEQAQGKTADARSDIFSFGLVLYELLSGRRAFAGDSAIETMAAIVRDEPAPLDAAIPPRLSELVARCLRKAPASRFQTMAEVRAALEEVTVVRPGETPSIAVLPFVNLSADKENEYFSDGLAEEILNLLAKIPGLKVIARTSAFAFRGKEQDIRKIAEALGVRTILEGSVRRSGNSIRVSAQLIEAADGSHLWSQRYDRDMTDIFAMQDEIGQAISEALKVKLAPATKAMDIEAYLNYLKGLHSIARLTPESLAKAKEHFERALAIDPNYAPAYSGLAAYYVGLTTMDVSMGELALQARSFARKALAIDPENSLANSIVASMAAIMDFDWSTAEKYFGKAMAAEPVPPLARANYVVYYLHPLGRIADAMEQSRLALETDPLSMQFHSIMAFSLYFAKRYWETIEYARRTLEIDANYHMMWRVKGRAQLQAGLASEAITSFERVLELAPWSPVASFLAIAFRQTGDLERSREWARKLGDSPNQRVFAASYYALAGDTDAMFASLEEVHRQRESILSLLVQREPFFDPYRADPRFQSLLRRMNLA